jgi:hypothetical protein
VVTPIKQTASQTRDAPGLASVVGIAPAFSAGVAIKNHTNEGTALLLPSARDSNNQAIHHHGASSNGRSATSFPNLEGQLLPTGQSAFPALRWLETRIGDLASTDVICQYPAHSNRAQDF